MDEGFERQAEWLDGAREMTPTLDELTPMPERERRRWREAFERYQDELQQLMDALDDALMNDR
jgi:hypothetical protein